MIKHSDFLHKKDWDILVILDACRFDTFEKIYKDYIPDSVIEWPLRRVNSEVSETISWLSTHWQGWHEILYVSGNPYINSFDTKKHKYHAVDHFTRICDSWDWCYDKKTSRVLPEKITRDAIAWFNWVNDYPQMIVHYMQPHSPYLFTNTKLRWYERIRNIIPFDSIPNFMKNWVKRNYKREDMYSKIKGNDNILIQAYENNLRSVLPSVMELVTHFKGKRIIVTSDHAEYLGENGLYGHWGEINDFITSVPYIILKW